MTEVELCQNIESFYRDYEIFKEVPIAYGRIDMVVKKGPFIVGIEAKMQFNTAVIYQAYRNRPFVNYSYVYIPQLKDLSNGKNICEALGVGILCFDGNRVEEVLKAKYQRKTGYICLQNHMKNAVAGAQHNSESEFKCTIREIERLLARQGGSITVKKLFLISHWHYSHSQSAKQNITRLIRQGLLPQFSINDGVISLTSKPVNDLFTH